MNNTEIKEACSIASSQLSAVAVEWDPLKQEASSVRLEDLINFAIERCWHTTEYSRVKQEVWAATRLKEGWKPSYVRGAWEDFRSIVRRAGIEGSFPLVEFRGPRRPRRVLSHEQMSSSLYMELWRFFSRRRLAAYRSKVELNPRAEREVAENIHELCWYAAKILQIEALTSLTEVLNESVVRSWALWLHEKGRCSRNSVKSRLSNIHATLKKHPDYWNRDLSWIPNALRQIHGGSASSNRVRNTVHSINFKELVAVIRQLHKERCAAMGRGSSMEKGWLVHDQLLFMFIALAQWSRESVIRCRIGTAGANLYKAPLSSEDMPLDVQSWAKNLWLKRHSVRLWQYRFSPKETRSHSTVYGVLHNFMIPLLELYLKRYRSKLLEGRPDPGTLFFSRKGKPLKASACSYLIGDLTCKHTSSAKRISPRGIASSFANYWERRHPGKHEQLALIQGRRIPTIEAKFPKQ